MKTNINLRKSIVTALCMALCVVVPMAFHSIPNAAKVFSPIFISVLLCGLLCGPVFGGICGVLGILLSSVLTGMPPAAMLPQMITVGLLYGAITGLAFELLKQVKTIPRLYISLVIGMLIGKVLAGLASTLIFTPGKYTIKAWATSYFVVGLPGIIVQLIVVPVIAMAIIKSKVLQPSETK